MDLLDNNDFQMKPHYGADGSLKGFTQKDYLGNKSYYDSDSTYKGVKIKDPFTDKSKYYDSNNKYMGESIHKFDGHGFMKASGDLGHTPKMFEIKDPSFHKNVHDHFTKFRSGLLNNIR